MPRVADQFADGEFDGDGDFEEADWHYEFDDSTPTILCPYCQEEIPEDTPKCPYCGDYISKEDHREKPYPRWVMATALILVILMVVGLAFGN